MLALVAFTAIQAPVAMTLPMGVSAEYHQAIQSIGAASRAGDWARAESLLRLLPSQEIRLEWDDSAVPSGFRHDFATERTTAIRAWKVPIPSLEVQLVRADSDLKIRFDDGSATRLSWNSASGKPRLEAVIGMRRGGAATLDPLAVHNETAYVLGAYFGISRLPLPGFVMNHPEMEMPGRLKVGRLEYEIAQSGLTMATSVRNHVARKRAFDTGNPGLAASPLPLAAGPVLQGSRIDFEIPLTNPGTGDLAYRVIPDCSCFGHPRASAIKSGGSDSAKVSMDTTEFGGLVKKTLYLLTNDPVQPVRLIPVEVTVTPRFRLSPDRGQVFLAEGGRASLEGYLYAPADRPLRITGVEVEGLEGEGAAEAWEGILPDPALNEGPLLRKGYRLRANVRDVPPGRYMVNLVLSTDDPKFGVIRVPFFVQTGILTQPGSLFFGEIGSAPREAAVLLSRPGRAFKVLSIESDSQHLSARELPGNKGDEHRILITYDGKAVTGDYSATVTVKTDDPDQPEISVGVSATIR